MKRTLMALLVALLSGAGLLWLVARGSGYVLVNYAGYQLEMSFWTGLLALLALLLVVRWVLALLRWLLRAGGLLSWWRDRRRQSASSRREKGLAALAVGDWSAAQRLLVSAQPHGQSKTDRLLAARALGAGDSAAALELLAPLVEQGDRNGQLLAAELATDDSRVMALLEPLVAAKKAPPAALERLFEALVRRGLWLAAGELLANSSLPPAQAQPLYRRWLRGQLPQVETVKQAHSSWRKLPAALREEPALVADYAQRLAELEETAEAEKYLLKALQKQQQRSESPYSRACLAALLTLPEAGLNKRLRALEALLENRREAALAYTIARLCQQGQLWGRARDFALQALELAPTPRSHRLLAEVYLKLGEAANADQQFRRGLELATAEQG